MPWFSSIWFSAIKQIVMSARKNAGVCAQRLRMTSAKEQGKTTVGYGAPAKGNTLLNYCGIGTDLLDYTVDASPHKQGLYLPGSRIPIYAPSRIAETRPDYVLILPWNLKDEIMAQMAHVRGWGGQFVLPVPVLSIVD